MRVMRDSGSDRTFRGEPKTADETHCDPTGGFVAFDEGDLGEVAMDVGFDLAVIRFYVEGQVFRAGVVFDHADDIRPHP